MSSFTPYCSLCKNPDGLKSVDPENKRYEGNVELNLNESFLTLEPFKEYDELYLLIDHNSKTGNKCSTRNIYSLEEKNHVIKKCNYCDYVPREQDFVRIFLSNIPENNIIFGKLVYEYKSNVILSYEDKFSFFTGEPFERNEKIYKVIKHNLCDLEIICSKDEMDRYIKRYGCINCRFTPNDNEIIEIIEELNVFIEA
jgi:hypothetical protein